MADSLPGLPPAVLQFRSTSCPRPAQICTQTICAEIICADGTRVHGICATNIRATNNCADNPINAAP